MNFEFTQDDMAKIFTAAIAKKYYPHIMEFLSANGIDTRERVAAFLAQTYHESGGFKRLDENLNYSASALERVFSKYFSKAGRKASDYARKPEAIANIVYANRMGNGGTNSGDGWRHRGGGLIQLTGKDNQSNFAKDIGMSLDDAIDYIRTPKGGVHSAVWFWNANNLNSYADKKNIKGMTKRINGGYNGLEDRLSLWDNIYSVISELPDAEEKKLVEQPVEEETNVQVEEAVESCEAPEKETEKEVLTISGFEVLGIGSRNGYVKEIQLALGTIPDSIFGPNTRRAVKNFQRKNGLIPDGYVGPRLYQSIIDSAD